MIIRTEKTSNYTRIPNDFLLDENISDKARGLLARLLSRPDNWNLNINYLAKTGKDGHTAIRSAIKELEEAGYIHKEVARHENGRIIGVEYIIRESPVKSCGDVPTPEQRVPSCVGTDLAEVSDNENEPFLPDPEPEPISMEAQAQETPTQGAHIEDNHMMETVIKETAPIITNDIKQTLKVITTTTPEPKPVICDQARPLLSSCSSNEILNLIPEKHRSPMVVTFVNKAIVDYPANEVEDAVAYAAWNVRGGSMQFRAYLDKTLQNKWAEGYFESMQERSPHGISWTQMPRGGFHNGFVTGSRRMDANLAACLEFAAYCEGQKEVMA